MLRMDHNMTGMMDMVIHFREREIILFSFWKTGTISEMAVSMFISFLLCVLYEAIKGFRLFLAITHMKPRLNVSASQSPLTDSGGDNVLQDSISFSPMIHGTGLTRRVFSGHRMVQAILYGIQALLAYVLMLIVMTFNGNLILSIVVGEAVGYLLFVGTPLADSRVADCC
ncbi:Ctr copper transporter family protein [Necator americanus]|uniref:Copper transport protein n=1 Tax=Necator americanus TaxID=51031 RepID=W2SZG3_NECAM|nr:Ctr copper transporter family protein [Necator americanus]ETN74102.1 Ctr copper transporter family protein [Necator americanus]